MHVRFKLVVAVLFVALLLAACGKGTPAPTPTSVPSTPVSQAQTAPTKAPTAKPTPTKAMKKDETKQEPTVAPTPTASAMEEMPGEAKAGMPEFKMATEKPEFKSFRAHMAVRVQIPQKDVDITLFSMELTQTQDPSAQRIVMKNVSGSEEDAQQMEIIQIEQDTWMNLDGSWFHTSGEEVPSVADDINLFDPGDVEASRWEKVGKEKVAGVDTIHYRFVSTDPKELGAMEEGDLIAQALGSDDRWTVTPKKLSLDVYATKDDMVMKNTLVWSGTATNGKETVDFNTTFEYAVTEVNTDITIEPPEDAQLPEEVIPLPEGAQVTAAMGGLRMYQVPGAKMEEVVDFMNQQLPAQGFSIEDSQNFGQVATFTVVKDGQKHVISITMGDDGTPQIMIQSGE